MNFKIGDFVCAACDDDPTTALIWQVVEIEERPNGNYSIRAYSVFDYRCNPKGSWGGRALSASADQLVHAPEMVILARAANGEHMCGRPKSYIERGVWTREDYEASWRRKP